MLTNRLGTLGLVGLAAGILACGTVSGLGAGAPTGSPAVSSQTDQTPGTTEEAELRLPLTPDPWTVSVTLDSDRTSTGLATSGVARPQNVELFDAGGNQFDLHVPDFLMTADEGGSLISALGTPVSLTAMETVEGLPFEGEFVAGVQIGPEGIRTLKPATLTLTLLGSFAPGTLFGFAASDSGAEFHLVPIQVVDMPGVSGLSPLPTMPFFLPPELATLMPPTGDLSASSTLVSFEMMHFSGAGVIRSTIETVRNRESHPPTSVADQTDDLLSPLPPSPYDVHRIRFRDSIKPQLDPIDKLEPSATCYKVFVAAMDYASWQSSVRFSGLLPDFSKETKTSRTILEGALKDCLKTTCNACIGAPNRDAYMSQLMLVGAYTAVFGEQTSMALWAQLTNQCADRLDREPPFPGDYGCGDNCAAPGPTTPALVCPK